MPTYQYACTACDERLEVVQKFTDEPLTECPVCDGRLRKVYSAVGVVFKGSGFYRTDSREKAKSTSNGSSGTSDPPSTTKPEPASTSTSTESTTAKPAAAPATKSPAND